MGIKIAFKDSLILSKFIKNELAKYYSIKTPSLSGLTIVRFDTSATALSWNKVTAVFIVPFSNHGFEECTEQCIKLLNQSDGESILSNKEFIIHTKLNCDAGIWMQAAPY